MNTDEIRALMANINILLTDVDMCKSKWQYTTGEVKDAYHLIYKDSLWRLQKKIGQLWFYVCEQQIVPMEETIAS